MVEQKTENLRVGGSIPPPGTTFLLKKQKSLAIRFGIRILKERVILIEWILAYLLSLCRLIGV